MRDILCRWCHRQLQKSYWTERWVHIHDQDAFCLNSWNGRIMVAEPLIEDTQGL